jgi:hypothetical protein
LSIVWCSEKLENTVFWKLDLFPSSGGRGDTYSVGSLRKTQPPVIQVQIPKIQ